MTGKRGVRVLVAEDDENLRTAVGTELEAAGLEVTSAADLATAAAAIENGVFACLVLDRMFPDGDAVTLVRDRRLAGYPTPVLFLTARDTVADRIAGFDHGGDDYLVKPFAMAELVARVRVLCRRGDDGRPPILRYADVVLDCARRETRRGGVLLTLSAKEFAVLEYLMVHPDQVVSRTELIEHCWDEEADPMSNVVDVVIRRLRRKLREPDLVHAVRGAGYRLMSS
ncbi:response regulator transcription factor [Amycolatopsis sp. GM8]|uniref:response regulator transcription factor n=1 Tax=Amycolatopsis sp. GM8 TaxID=2896530 RepID=UPI001F21E978|nr:response regulator transcription factor [Amycolatopsis sp. GM8]